MRVLISGGIPLGMLFAGFASAQHAQPDGMSAQRTSAPYNIEAFGVFRDLMLRGDFSPKVVIGSVMSRLPSTGVGAVSGARGEITIADGKLIISYGKSDAHPPLDTETAALLATGRVKEWQTVRMNSDVSPSAVEAFLAQAAKALSTRNYGPRFFRCIRSNSCPSRKSCMRGAPHSGFSLFIRRMSSRSSRLTLGLPGRP